MSIYSRTPLTPFSHYAFEIIGTTADWGIAFLFSLDLNKSTSTQSNASGGGGRGRERSIDFVFF